MSGLKILLLIIDLCLILYYLNFEIRKDTVAVMILATLGVIGVALDLSGTMLSLKNYDRTALVYSLFWIPVYAVGLYLFQLAIKSRHVLISPYHRDASLHIKIIKMLVLLLFFTIESLNLPPAVSETETPSMTRQLRVFNYSQLSWVDGFTDLNQTLAKFYPFTQWKNIDWQELYYRYEPEIARAERKHDRKSYYLALRKYTYSIPDGHVKLEGYDWGLKGRAVGGGYGMKIVGLDDGEIVVTQVYRNGPAYRAGIRYGARILAWDGKNIQTALKQVSLIWCHEPVATAEGRKWEEYYYLLRSPVGTRVTVVFQNRNDSAVYSRILCAHAEVDSDEGTGWLDLLQMGLLSPIQAYILPDGWGYVKIVSEFPSLFCFYPEKDLGRIITQFNSRKIPGLILDLRGNLGGSDDIAIKYLNLLVNQKRIYEYPGVYNPKTENFTVQKQESNAVVPQLSRYHGSICVLVDHKTISAAEGIPLMLKGMPRVKIIGWQGTQGSFGLGQIRVILPGGYALNFPQAQSLGADCRIQVDSDDKGNGGVIPDLRVPLTRTSIDLEFKQGKDVVLEYGIKVLRTMVKK